MHVPSAVVTRGKNWIADSAFDDATSDLVATHPAVGLPLATVIVVCVAMTVWIGVLPTIIVDFARDASLIV